MIDVDEPAHASEEHLVCRRERDRSKRASKARRRALR